MNFRIASQYIVDVEFQSIEYKNLKWDLSHLFLLDKNENKCKANMMILS